MPKHRPPRRFVRLRESAPAVEAAPLVESTAAGLVTPASGGRLLVQLISEGWGSSGYYAGSVLEQAARDRRFPAGLPLFLDHPSATEEHDRPERSVRDLAAVLTEDARWDQSRRALIAEAKALPTYRDLLTDRDFVEAVGLSIRAGGLAEYGTAEGRDGLIVKEITEAQSVDFVTRAGRGGKVLALLESARTKLREAPTEQVRAALDKAVRDAYSSDDRYAWVRDWDPDRSVCWFDLGGPDGGTWEQQYLTSGADVALLGPRRQVTAVTVYRPVGPPPAAAELGESANPTTTDVTDGAPPTGSPNTPEEEPDMSGTNTGGQPGQAGTAPVVDTAAIQLEAREAAVARDRAVGERDTALAEAATQKARADKAEAELALFRAVESARPLVAAQLAEAGLPAAAQARITAGVTQRVPMTESGQLDQNGLRTLVEAEVTAEKAYLAQLQEAAGAGQVTGFGQAPAQQPPAATSWSTPAVEPNAALVEAYRGRGLTAEAARAAAQGRAV
ncbi:hypothetical protein [Dactylosporangium salmoneum]|uniref:Uncharacterized protein n=1 Tax=Dactylosporangium salmoneum TaxID=53361 RepID=A0ABP5T7U6_9ACTN